jgi:glyoxylate/hydroxypyruvate reductase
MNLPMGPFRVITYGRLSEEVEAYVKLHLPEIEIYRAKTLDNLKHRLPHYNVYAGLNHLHGLALGHLQWIHAFGAGVDSFLAMPQLPPHLLITRTTGDMDKKIGEYCLAYLLAEYRNILFHHQKQAARLWDQQLPDTLHGKQVMILGTGFIAQGIAQTLRPLADKIVGVNQSGKSHPSFNRVISWQEVPNHASSIDVVINSLPLTPGTHHLVNSSFLSAFRDIVFLNIGRGATVETEGLLQAMEKSNVKRAILDVFEQEPLPPDSLLWGHSQVWLTPHVSGITSASDASESLEAAYRALEQRKMPVHTVDRTRGY